MRPDVFERTNPDLLRRYSYLRKEMAQYKSGYETKIENTTYVPESNNPYDITEEQFRDAARIFYNTLAGYNGRLAPTVVFYEGKVVWINHSFTPKPIEEYVKAFEALPIIYNGLVPFAHLTYNDNDTGNGLSRYYLREAVMLYVLTKYGNMTMPDLYDLCLSDRYMEKVFDIFKTVEHRNIANFPDWAMWARNRSLAFSPCLIRVGRLMMNRFSSFTQNEVMSARVFLINGSLYTKNISKEQQFLLDNPEYENEIAKKKAVVDSLQLKIDKLESNGESQAIVALRKQLQEKEESLQTKVQEVERLRRKIFGRKKAVQQAEDIEREMTTIKMDADSLKQSIQKQVDAEKKSVAEELNSIRSKKDDADKAYSELLQKKDELLSEYSEFFCYYGPDSTIQPEQPPEDLDGLNTI